MSNSKDRRLPTSGVHRWIPVALLKVDRSVQREASKGWVLDRVAGFDVDKLGIILVSDRGDGFFYVIDGQHRVELVRAVGWGDQSMECEVMTGLTREQEATLFIARNDKRSVGSYDLFLVRMTAADEVALGVDRLVRANGLTVSKDKTHAGVSAVVALERVYRCHGERDFARMLRVLRDAFGADRQSFSSPAIEGVGMVVGRFNGTLDDAVLVKALESVGSPSKLRQLAGVARETFGRSWAESTAIAVTDLYNKGRRTGRLTPWLKAVAQDEAPKDVEA